MNDWICPTGKHVCYNEMHVLSNFDMGKHNSFMLGPIQPSSPTSKELDA